MKSCAKKIKSFTKLSANYSKKCFDQILRQDSESQNNYGIALADFGRSGFLKKIVSFINSMINISTSSQSVDTTTTTDL